MNKTQEALKMAIEAMEASKEAWHEIGIYDSMYDNLVSSIQTCKEAIAQPAQEVGDAEIKQMLDDIEWYQKRVEELEAEQVCQDSRVRQNDIQPAQEPVVFSESDLDMFQDNAERYNLTTTHRAPEQSKSVKQWQGLSDKDLKGRVGSWVDGALWAEKLLKEKNGH